jgi:hypothetical protein
MRFRRLSPEELHTWKKTKNKVRAIQKIKQEEDENAPDGIPFYEVGKPITDHKKYVAPLYSNGRLIRTRTGLRRKYVDWELADMRSSATFTPEPPRHFRSMHNFPPQKQFKSKMKSFRGFVKENYASK